jgi:hypothetical protein
MMSSRVNQSGPPTGLSMEPRRSKACENCRGLKVRCISSDPTNPSAACVRCLRGKKDCVFNLGPRKRSKKTDTRVAALEMKLELLSAALNEKNIDTADIYDRAVPGNGFDKTNHPPVMDSSTTSLSPIMPGDRLIGTPSSSGATHRSLPQAQRILGTKDPKFASLNGTPEDLEVDYMRNGQSFRVDTGVKVEVIREEMVQLWNTLQQKCTLRLQLMESSSANPRVPTAKTDVISRGIISMENARVRLEIYRNIIYPKYPLIHVADEVTLEQFREEQPTLFLCVMATTSMAVTDPGQFEACLILHNRAYEAVVYDTMLVGSMTFELLQCLILLTYWYNEPEFYHRHKSHQLAILAHSMAQDLGIGGMLVSSRNASLRFERIVTPQVLVDAKNIHCRKLWLSSYCASMNLLSVSRKASLSIWSEYTEECCEMVGSSEVLLPEEKRIVQFAQLAHVFEDISKAFYSGGRRSKPPDIADVETKYLVAHFEARLKRIYDAVTASHNVSVSFLPYYHAVNAYLHQSVIYVPYSEGLGRSPFSDYSLAVDATFFSADAVHCILACYSSATKALELFNDLTVEQYAMLPLFNYTRLVFCASALLKLRALSICNVAFHEACPVPVSKLDLLYGILDKMNEVGDRYPFSNSAVCFSFVIKLLMCHFDGQVHYILGEKNRGPQDEEAKARHHAQMHPQVDPALTGFAENQSSQSSNAPCVGMYPSSNAATASGSDSGVPGSPLDVLSSAALDTHRRSLAVPAELARRGRSEEQDDFPVWLSSDDFWKDLMPNVEAFTGYDVM